MVLAEGAQLKCQVHLPPPPPPDVTSLPLHLHASAFIYLKISSIKLEKSLVGVLNKIQGVHEVE